MKIVAVDFSFSQRSVAALNGGKVVEVVETDPRKTNVLAMIAQALEQVQLPRDTVECVAVGLGPGSYTGIRASIAMAQGWQLATGVKLLGISSAEMIANQAQHEGLRGPVNVVIDAQRGEFYLARFELNDARAKEIEALRIVSSEQLKESAATDLCVGPEVHRWIANGRIVLPRAETLARIAAHRNEFVPGEKLEPIYLRETSFVKAPPPRVIL
jgi:universal bacterial protein YeaZ